MTDSTLRELERRFRASGSVEDEVAWLRARVQAGDLDQRRLELAAYCSHRAAEEALNGKSHCPPPQGRHYSEIERWASGLERFGDEVPVRAAIAAAWRVLDTNSPPPVLVRVSRRALRCAEAWCLTPGQAAAKVADKAWLDAECAPWREVADDEERWRARFTVAAAAAAAAAASNSSHAGRCGLAARSLDLAGRAVCEDILRYAFGTAEVIAEDEGLDAIKKELPSDAMTTILSAVGAELVPFALGYSDPLRERVEARQLRAADE